MLLCSRFAMEVDGIFYIAQVKQKQQAWRLYQEAIANNQTAGHVDSVEARHSNRWGEAAEWMRCVYCPLLRFRVSVNTEAESRVQFHLVYEELLARRGGRYTYTTNILPQLRLASYSLGLTITETRAISSLAVRRLSLRPEAAAGGEEVAGAEVLMSPTDPGKVTVSYTPDVRTLEHDLRHEKHPLQVGDFNNI